MITINQLTKAMNVAFAKTSEDFMKAGISKYDDVYTVVPSTQESETYPFLGELPIMREWIGEKRISGLKDYTYTITNKDWESTLALSRNVLKFDNIGVVMPKIKMLAIEGQRHKARLIRQLIINGTSGLAYDGNAFFANRTVNDNLMAGTGTTLTQLETDLATARATMWSFVDDQGEPFEFPLDTVVCPPALEVSFKKIMESTASVTGVNQGVINPFRTVLQRVIVDPGLTDANDWYGLCTSFPLKPFIYQEVDAPKLVAMDKQDDLPNFMRKKLYYSVESLGNAGYSFYQFGIKVVNA